MYSCIDKSGCATGNARGGEVGKARLQHCTWDKLIVVQL